MNWIKVNDGDESTLPPLEKVVHIIFLSDFNEGQVIALGGRTDGGEGWLWAINDSNCLYRSDSEGDLTTDDDYHVTHWAEIEWPEEG